MALSSILRHGSKLCASPQFTQNVLLNSKVNLTKAVSNGIAMNKNFLAPKGLARIVTKRMFGSDHAQQWKLEKVITIIMFPIIPATFSNPGTEILDNLFAILVTTHAHFGLAAIAKDYIRPILFGPVIPKIAVALVYALTATTLGSLLYFNHHNIGIGAAGRKIWTIGKAKESV